MGSLAEGLHRRQRSERAVTAVLHDGRSTARDTPRRARRALGRGGRLAQSQRGGHDLRAFNPRLVWSPTAAPETALPLASPQSTGLAGADWASFGVPGDLPGDQALDSFGSLEFDSAALAAQTEILGHARVVLEVTADRPVAIVTARLIDVAPDGRATLVARGFLAQLKLPASNEHPPAAGAGEQHYRVRICNSPEPPTRFPRAIACGWLLSTAYWPVIWPAPEPVTVTVFTGASQLLLPVRHPSPGDQSSYPITPTGRRACLASDHQCASRRLSHAALTSTRSPGARESPHLRGWRHLRPHRQNKNGNAQRSRSVTISERNC